MDEIVSVLKSIPLLDPTLYGMAVVLGILLRFARGYFANVNGAHTFWAAVGLGVIGSVISLATTARWDHVAVQGLALIASTLVTERVLRMAADKLAFIPKDNEWVTSNKENKSA